MDPVTALGVTASTLCGFRGALEGLKTHVEFNASDGERLSTINHLEAPLGACKDSLELVTQRLNTVSFVGKYIVGSMWDASLRKALQRLDDAKDLLELAMHADQRIIMTAVERHVRCIASGVCIAQQCVNENGKRILSLDDKMHDIVDGLDQVETKWDAKQRHLETQACQEKAWHDFRLQKMHADILQWLFHSDPNINHNVACDKRNEHTVFYYFSFSDPAKQTVRNFLYSALLQLMQRRDSFLKSLAQLYDEYRVGEPPLARVVDVLESVLVSAGDVFMVLDALDECPLRGDERSLLLSTLSQIIGWRVPGLRALVTSREEDDIQRRIKLLITMEPISIQGEVVLSDTRRHVRKELDEEFRNHDWPSDLKLEVEDAPVNGTKGVFRWISLQLASVRRCKRPIDVRRELKLLPKTVDETYERILLDIEEPYREYAERALHWLAFAGRTLRPEELFEAVVMKPGKAAQFQPLVDGDRLVKCLSSLISVVKRKITTNDYDYPSIRTGTSVDDVKLAHYSVQEYLASQRIHEGPARSFHINAGNSHALIGEACLGYLLMFDKKDSIRTSSLLEWRLLSYAARNWYVHVRQAANESQASLAELAAQLLNMKCLPIENQVAMENWLRVFDPDLDHLKAFVVRSAKDVRAYVGIVGIYYASCLDLTETVRLLLSAGKVDLNASWGNFRGCLPAAAQGGYDDIVAMLLDHGADVRNQGISGQNSLERSIWKRQISTIRLLLSRGARVRAKTSSGDTMLHTAVRVGNAEACELLLSHGADIDAQDNYGYTPLHSATSNSTEAIISCLIRHGAKVDVFDEDGETPLHHASRGCSGDTISLLLSRGVAKDVLSSEGMSPLWYAVYNGNHEAASALLQHGVRVLYRKEAEGEEPKNTLVELLRNALEDDYIGLYDIEKDGHDLLTPLLLEYGYGLESEYGDLLLLAASRGWDQTAEYLVTQTRVNLLHRNANGETELHVIIKTVADHPAAGCFEFTCPWIQRLERIIDLILAKAGHETTRARTKDIGGADLAR
ncbi:hypothetical protein OQA88_11650 [Cercophora sp. LCS_1]